jgi:hypothetical protein
MPQSFPSDPKTLGFAVIALGIALEEALKALAGKNESRAGPWLDEVQDLALLRARAVVVERASVAHDNETVTAALNVAEVIFSKIRTGLPE